MSNSFDYQRISQTLARSLTAFRNEELDYLFGKGDGSASALPDQEQENEVNPALKARWQEVLTQGSDLADYTKSHYRAQSPQVLAALEEMAKYSDVHRPFRLSVIGQKGVGKSALVNALLGASRLQYTPSEVAGKAVSGTRIRLMANSSRHHSHPQNLEAPGEVGLELEKAEAQEKEKEKSGLTQPPGVWQVVFLTPARLWEIGSYLLMVARMKVPSSPTDLSNSSLIMKTLEVALAEAESQPAEGELGSTMQIQARSARDTLTTMLKVYRQKAATMPPEYRLWLQEEDVEGPISPYIRQTEDNLYLIVDYVERYLPPEEAGLLGGRPIELEDVLGLDDPRDSFFALEAFKEAFAVIMVFRCDRGLNTESTSLLRNLFSRDESEFGSSADLNKAIIVANQFDSVTANITTNSPANPLKGIEDIGRELSRYTRQPVPIYLTSAQMAQNAQNVLLGSNARPSAAYTAYLDSLANLLQVVSEQGKGIIPDYLDFMAARRAEIEAGPGHLSGQERASLILEMSGLPRLTQRVQQALEASAILRSRVANAEYYYTRSITETALCYARQMKSYNLELGEFNQLPASLESRLFSKFQHETRQHLEGLDEGLKQNYFGVARRYIHGPMPAHAEAIRQQMLVTIQKAVLSNRQLIRLQPHIATGETVTDSWRKVFEELNDWLALETGRQLRGLVGPLLAEIEGLTATLQKELTTLAASPRDYQNKTQAKDQEQAQSEVFWANYQNSIARLRLRLLAEAEGLAVGYYTDHRFSVYDLQIAEALHVGEASRRREAIIELMQARLEGWFSNLWHLLAKVAMNDLAAFGSELRYYVLGLPADGSLAIGFEVAGRGEGLLAPEQSLTALLNQRYHTSENFRRQYALREPTPAERLSAEIREWLALVVPPLDGLAELGKAVGIVGVGQAGGSAPDPVATSTSEAELEVDTELSATWPDTSPVAAPGYTRLRFPIESRHPYNPITRQVWELTNPDQQAAYTRLHFSRIELGSSSQGMSKSDDRLILNGQGRPKQQIITGTQSDFWSEAFPGRTIILNFVAENSTQPGWGFVLDGIESVASATVSVSHSDKAVQL